MDNKFTITQQILRHRLSEPHTIEEDLKLLNQLLPLNPVYFADSQTKAPCVRDYTLTLYLTASIARMTRGEGEFVVADGDGMAKTMIESLSKSREIHAVKFYGVPPVSAVLKLHNETGKRAEPAVPESPAQPESPVTPDVPALAEEPAISGAPAPPDTPPPPPVESSAKPSLANREWKLVPEVKQALSMPAAADRRKIDPAAHFENLHSLLGKLIQANGLDPADLDRHFGMPQGFTKSLCEDLKRDTTPKDIVRRYLDLFGLSQYLYLFRNECSEIAEELRKNPQIDVYKVKLARNTTEERFELMSVKSKLDNNGALIYRLELESPHRTQIVISSTPFNFIVGKSYAIEGLAPITNKTDANKAATKGAATLSAAIVSSKEEEAEVLAKIQAEMKNKGKPSQRQEERPKQSGRMSGKNRYMDETPEEKFEREKGIVLEYIIRTCGCNARDAQAKFEPLADHPDIVSDFAKYIKTRKPGSCSSHGYNAKRLMDKLHYGPYDAYVMLASLERDPKKTQEVLKYRETDPQYQKPEKTAKD